MTVSQAQETDETVRKLSEPVRVVRLPDPALGRLIALRGQGYGWEDICVLLQREGILVSRSDIRRFILGPKRTTASAGATTEAVKLGQTQN